MKNSKKFLSVLCAVCMILTMAAPAFAANTQATPDVRGLAYMNTEIATPEQRADIIAARREIVYGHQAWTVNGSVVLMNKDGTFEELPEFSDIFPGWDLAEICAVPEVEPMQFNVASLSPRAIGYSNTIQLKMPVSDVNTSPFYTFNGTGENVLTWAQTISAPEGQKYFNVGYTNEDIPDPDHPGLGTDLGWIPDIPVNEKIAVLRTDDGTRYGVRASASAYGVAGYGFVHVEITDMDPVIN